MHSRSAFGGGENETDGKVRVEKSVQIDSIVVDKKIMKITVEK